MPRLLSDDPKSEVRLGQEDQFVEVGDFAAGGNGQYGGEAKFGRKKAGDYLRLSLITGD